MYLLSRHDDLQKSKSQTVNSESECLRWTDATRSWNVRLQVINHSHERFVSSDKNFWRVYCCQKSQNQLSINCEIIDVYHAKNSIEHNLFYLDDQSLCLQSFSNSSTSSQAHFSLSTRNTSDETDVSRSIKSLKSYTNSNWTENQDIRRSISEYAFNVDNDVISWFSKRQLIVTLFICEIEYTRQTLIAKEVIWLRNLMTQLTCDVEYFQTIMIYEDNQNVIVLIKNSLFNARIKHIDIQTHFIREKVIENSST